MSDNTKGNKKYSLMEDDMDKCFEQINAIARGVEVKLDLLTGHSMVVVQQTSTIAQRLGIPKEEIQKWATTRQTLDAQTNTAVRLLRRN